MCYILYEKYIDTDGFFEKLKFIFTKKIRITKTSIGNKEFKIKVIIIKLNKKNTNKRIIRKIVKKISDNKVILQINSGLKQHLINKGVKVVDRRGFFKRHFNKLTLQLLKTLELDPGKLKTYVILDENEQIDNDFINELCLLSNQLCICTNDNIDIEQLCEDIYENLGASVTTAKTTELSNKNGIYFIFSEYIDILRRLKKTSTDKLIFTYHDFNEYSSKNKTVIDGAYLDLSPKILEKLPYHTDIVALASAMDEDNMLEFSDFSLRYFLSCNIEITGNRLLKMKLLDS